MVAAVDFLFGLSIYKEKIEPSSYDKEKIIETIEHNYNISKYRGSGFGDWHDSYKSYDKRFKEVDFSKVQQIYLEKLKKFCINFLQLKKSYNVDFETINYTANREDSYMEPHNHPTSDFSFIHYVQVPSGAAPIRFMNQNGFAPYIPVTSKDLYKMIDAKNSKHSWLFGHYTILPKEDDLFIFPSVLFHQVPVNKAKLKKCRISIVSNLTIKNPQDERKATLQ